MNKITFLIWLFLLPLASFSQPYKYLALKGGGIRGIAYTGALKVLEEKNISPYIEKVAGTSAGAIVGALFCMGYSAKEMEEIMFGLNIATFNDGSWFFLGGQRRMRKNYGWYKGRKLESWIGWQVKQKTGDENTTFMQLHRLAQNNKHFRDLYVTATNLSSQKLEVFSWETFPDLPVKTAVHASAAVPLYYGAVFIDSSGRVATQRHPTNNYNVYVDGGLMDNYPIDLFNEPGSDTLSPYALGMKLERPEQIEFRKTHIGLAPFNIHSFGSYMGSLYNIVKEQLNKTSEPINESKHSIYISNGNISPRVRHISTEQKEKLFNLGVAGAEQFFEGKR